MSNRTVDHTGKVFRSMTAMCEHWGINVSTFETRLEKGATLEEALTTPVMNTGKKMSKKAKHVADNVDHQGRQFPSQSAMCAHWGVSRALYKNRLYHGWTKEAALSEPVKPQPGHFPPFTHRGRHYASLPDFMVREAGRRRGSGGASEAYHSRIERGMTHEQALDDIVETAKSKVIVIGNERFKSLRELADAKGVSVIALHARIYKLRTAGQEVDLGKVIRSMREKGGHIKSKEEWAPRTPVILFGWKFKSFPAARTYWTYGLSMPPGGVPSKKRARELQERAGRLDTFFMEGVADLVTNQGLVLTEDIRRTDEDILPARALPLEYVGGCNLTPASFNWKKKGAA